MKSVYKLIFAFSLAILFTFCNESINENEPEQEEIIDYKTEIERYFPSNLISPLVYSVDTLNKNTQVYKNIGSRSFRLNGTQTINSNEYLDCIQTFTLNEIETELRSKFRHTNSSILLLADTSHVSESIPDSLKGQLLISVDNEITLLQFPLKKGELWSVIKANVDFGAFKFNILDISGEYLGEETLVLDNFTESFSAEKFKYELKVNIPELDNPFLSEIGVYFAEVWFVKDIGIVKMEGCSLFINPLTGSYMDFGDTNKVGRQVLTSFE